MAKSWSGQSERAPLSNSSKTASLSFWASENYIHNPFYLLPIPFLSLLSLLGRTPPFPCYMWPAPGTRAQGLTLHRYLEFWARARKLAPKLLTGNSGSPHPHPCWPRSSRAWNARNSQLTSHRPPPLQGICPPTTENGLDFVEKKKLCSQEKTRQGVGGKGWNRWRGSKVHTSCYRINKSWGSDYS